MDTIQYENVEDMDLGNYIVRGSSTSRGALSVSHHYVGNTLLASMKKDVDIEKISEGMLPSKEEAAEFFEKFI